MSSFLKRKSKKNPNVSYLKRKGRFHPPPHPLFDKEYQELLIFCSVRGVNLAFRFKNETIPWILFFDFRFKNEYLL